MSFNREQAYRAVKRNIELTFLVSFLEQSEAEVILKRMWLDRKPGAVQEALFTGYSNTRDAVRRYAKDARDYGLLLFCWEDTQVFAAHTDEVPA